MSFRYCHGFGEICRLSKRASKAAWILRYRKARSESELPAVAPPVDPVGPEMRIMDFAIDCRALKGARYLRSSIMHVTVLLLNPGKSGRREKISWLERLKPFSFEFEN